MWRGHYDGLRYNKYTLGGSDAPQKAVNDVVMGNRVQLKMSQVRRSVAAGFDCCRNAQASSLWQQLGVVTLWVPDDKSH